MANHIWHTYGSVMGNKLIEPNSSEDADLRWTPVEPEVPDLELERLEVVSRIIGMSPFLTTNVSLYGRDFICDLNSYIYMHIYICIYIYIHRYIYIYIYIYIHTYIHTDESQWLHCDVGGMRVFQYGESSPSQSFSQMFCPVLAVGAIPQLHMHEPKKAVG